MVTGTHPNVSFAWGDNNHNPDRLWNVTAKPLWNERMRDYDTFDSETDDHDLVADNSILLMTTFCNHAAADPPIRKRLKPQ